MQSLVQKLRKLQRNLIDWSSKQPIHLLGVSNLLMLWKAISRNVYHICIRPPVDGLYSTEDSYINSKERKLFRQVVSN